MSKVHVISTPDRLEREEDSLSLWGGASQICKEVWFYLIMVNLVMGLVFIIMDVVYYDSCFLGTALTKTVPVTLFLIGVSQMSLSVIFPASVYFLKNKRVHVAFKASRNHASRKSASLFASLMVAMAVLSMMVFVVLGLGFASHRNQCHHVLVLFTQIVCSLYITGFVFLVVFALYKKKSMPSLHSHFDSSEEYRSTNGLSATHRENFDSTNPFGDNLSEVHLSESSYVEDTKPKPRVFTPKDDENSSDMMLVRYFLVIGGVIWLIATVPGIPILALGATFYSRCSSYRNVPDWLIAHGTILLFSAGALIGGWCIGRGKHTKNRLLFLIPACIIMLFLLIWPVVGVAWSDQVRFNMIKDPDTKEAKESGCTRDFVTGVLITSAIYSIPIFIFAYILFIFLLSLSIAAITLLVMWILNDESG